MLVTGSFWRAAIYWYPTGLADERKRHMRRPTDTVGSTENLIFFYSFSSFAEQKIRNAEIIIE